MDRTETELTPTKHTNARKENHEISFFRVFRVVRGQIPEWPLAYWRVAVQSYTSASSILDHQRLQRRPKLFTIEHALFDSERYTNETSASLRIRSGNDRSSASGRRFVWIQSQPATHWARFLSNQLRAFSFFRLKHPPCRTHSLQGLTLLRISP